MLSQYSKAECKFNKYLLCSELKLDSSNMKIIIATWNIAGGRKSKSTSKFDYLDEDIEYFSEKIKKSKAEIICIQESKAKSTPQVCPFASFMNTGPISLVHSLSKGKLIKSIDLLRSFAAYG